MKRLIKKLTNELEEMVLNNKNYNDIVKKSQEIDKLIIIEMKRMNKGLKKVSINKK